jgi:hypothetical protein
MSDQSVMTTPIFDELVAELGHDLEQTQEPEEQQPDTD